MVMQRQTQPMSIDINQVMNGMMRIMSVMMMGGVVRAPIIMMQRDEDEADRTNILDKIIKITKTLAPLALALVPLLLQEEGNNVSGFSSDDLARLVDNLQNDIRRLQADAIELKAARSNVGAPTPTEPIEVRRRLFGGRHEAVPIIDLTTGIVYHSKAATGAELSGEAGVPKTDKFAWYKLLSKFPNRFRPATEDEISQAKVGDYYIQGAY